MVICKYYLQGNCRFGDNCKFEHQISDFNAAVSTSILRQPQPQHQQQQQQQSQQQNADFNVAIRSVANDMLLAEKGGQWLLSCYAPFRAKPPFPGFNDTSFEEIRHGFLAAQRNGTLEQYKQQLQTMLHETAMRMRALQNPAPDTINIIKQLFNAPAANENAAKSAFSFAEAGKTVLQQNAAAIFPPKAPGGNIFAQANHALFGNQTAQQQQQQRNVFAQPQQPANSIFAPQQQTAVFAQSQWAGNAFQQQQQPAQATVFQTQQQQQPANVFQTTQQPTNVFQTPQQQPQQSNVFQQQIQTNQMSIFGGGNFGRAQSVNVDDSAYSKGENLTESEIRAFQADLFEFGQIPDKPPTIELCF